MAKVSKEFKNAHPDIYGYEHPWNIPGNTEDKIVVFCLPFIDADGDKRYCAVTEDCYKTIHDYDSKVFKAQDRLTRCQFRDEKTNRWSMCRADCKNCPKGKLHRDHEFVSLDQMKEKYNKEFSSTSEDSFNSYDDFDDSLPSGYEDAPDVAMMKRERSAELRRLISLMKETDQIIIHLFEDGLTDKEIAAQLNKPKTTVTSRREKLFADLREQLKDF